MGRARALPSVVITTGTSASLIPAAASRRVPSASSARSQRYGTRLRARKSRTANECADQRCPTTLVSGIVTAGAASHASSSASSTG